MEITLYKQSQTTDEQGNAFLVWKFKNADGNIFVTTTDINGTEMEAAAIILHSMSNNA